MYDGCEGPAAMYVNLISPDEQEFIVKFQNAEPVCRERSGRGHLQGNFTTSVGGYHSSSRLLMVVNCNCFSSKSLTKADEQNRMDMDQQPDVKDLELDYRIEKLH